MPGQNIRSEPDHGTEDRKKYRAKLSQEPCREKYRQKIEHEKVEMVARYPIHAPKSKCYKNAQNTPLQLLRDHFHILSSNTGRAKRRRPRCMFTGNQENSWIVEHTCRTWHESSVIHISGKDPSRHSRMDSTA